MKNSSKKFNGTKYTTRQWRLINLLVKTSNDDPNKWLSQQDIYNCYPYIPNEQDDGYTWTSDERVHDRCSTIWKDINNIRKIGEFRQVIVTKNNQYKLATKDEAIAYINNLKKKALLTLARASNVAHLVGLDGQGTLLDCRLNEITEQSKAKTVLETVVHTNSNN